VGSVPCSRAGPWNGHDIEIVYNPTRHDVMLVRGGAIDDIGDNGLEHIGYRFVATDGHTWLWYRDRLAAARNNLERIHGAAAVPTKALRL
jgi:hypothetical protein